MGRRSERGSSLMLVPSGVLVLLVLAAISVDSAIAFGAQRELINTAQGAANDAATVAITEAQLQRGRDARPDPVVAEALVREALVGEHSGGLVVAPEDVEVVVDDRLITVRTEGEVGYIFARALPGKADRARVSASATAELVFREG